MVGWVGRHLNFRVCSPDIKHVFSVHKHDLCSLVYILGSLHMFIRLFQETGKRDFLCGCFINAVSQ